MLGIPFSSSKLHLANYFVEIVILRSQSKSQRFVERGLRGTLDGQRLEKPPRAKLLDGKQEAKVIATRLGKATKDYANWMLRLLAEKVVELEIVDSISPQTVMRTLKKMA